MKSIVRTLVLGGALAGGLFATAGPASAACYDYPPSRDLAISIPSRPIVCYDYNHCDAYICL